MPVDLGSAATGGRTGIYHGDNFNALLVQVTSIAALSIFAQHL
jgi:hypothetical protein